MATKPKAGRRPAGTSDTRADILSAAKASFAQVGFDRSTIRGIASAAGVDPSLVMHYFGSKAQLFVECVEIPEQALSVFDILESVQSKDWGAAIAEVLIPARGSVAFNPTLVGIIRSASSEPAAAQMIAGMYEGQFLVHLRRMKLSEPAMRATMMSSLVIGLAFTGEVVGLPGFTRAPVAKQRALLASVVQQVLTAEIP
jgi:AcrR family transcriptional regulator